MFSNNKIIKNPNLLKKFSIIQFFIIFLTSFTANAAEHHSSRPDDHAPIGVMRDHSHEKGEYMLSYRYKIMSMKGARSENNDVSSDEVLSDYMMAPKRMDMKMHMFGGMYGVTNNLTLAAAGSFVEKDSKMINRSDKITNRQVSDFGDSKIHAMYKFYDNSSDHAQFNLGLSIPTGNIKQEYDDSRLAYGMQLGSGSYELLPGVSYSGYQDDYSYGAQVNAVFRLNNNNNNYQLGDSYNVTAWSARKLNEAVSISSRLNYTITDKIKGSDEELNVMMSSANNISSSGGRTLDFLIGTNFIFPNGFLKDHRLAVEGGVPVYQKFNGTQLKTDYKVTLGWQKSF